MTTALIEYQRIFQLWSYDNRHGQLLLRSVKTEIHTTQIDVLFKNVSYINIPVIVNGLRIISDTEDVGNTYPVPAALQSSYNKGFRLNGVDWHGVVVAGTVTWLESIDNYFDVSRLVEMP